MQVKIEHSCFYNSANYADLDSIFSLFVEGQHKWIDIDLDEIEKTEWFKKLGERRAEDLKKMFVCSTRKSSYKKTVQVLNDNEREFNVFEAKYFLKQPLTVVIENYEYEPIFINNVFEKFDYSKELISFKDMHWLNYENGGGSNDNTIKGKLKESYNNAVLKKEKHKYLRCFVIKDSDRKFCILKDGEVTVYQKIPENKTAYLAKMDVSFHILHKREKENYMPDAVFNQFLQTAKRNDRKKQFAKSYLSLSHPQKDFFDIENGFSKKTHGTRQVINREHLEPEVKVLYKNLSDSDYSILGNGLEYPNFKSSFSCNFDAVTKEDLEKRIRHQPLHFSNVNPKDKSELNEFEHLIREIKFLL